MFYLDSIKEFKEKVEKLKENPFNDVAKFLFTDKVALIFGLREPIEDLEEFKQSLTEEKDIAVYNCILEGYVATIPTYNFKTFEIIPAEVPEVDPNEPEIKVTKEFLEQEIEYLENLPEWLKNNLNITDEVINAKKEKLKNFSEEDVPEENSSEVDPTEKVAAEDSSENAVPTDEV